MPLHHLGQIRGRLLASGSVIIGGALCLGGFPDANTIAIAISTVTGILSGIVANDLGSLTERLRQNDRSNDDLTKAVGQAIALVILTAAEAETYPNYRRDLRKLAKTANQYWLTIANATTDAPVNDFAAIKDERLADLFTNRSNQVLELEAWRFLVSDWLSNEAGVQLPKDVVQFVAERLNEGFSQALREVLKADFEKGGKAFAELSLSMLGEMRQAIANNQVEILTQLHQIEHHPGTSITATDITNILSHLDALVQLQSATPEQIAQEFKQMGRQMNSGFSQVLNRIGLSELKISDLLGEVQATSEKTLTEVQQLREEEAGRHEELIPLIQAICTRQTQTSSLIFDDNRPSITNWQGRTDEIQKLKAWLVDEDTKLSGIVGIGGVGKSTLAAKLYEESRDFVSKFWADLSQKPAFAVLAPRVLTKLGYLSEAEVNKLDEAQLVEALVHCLRSRRYLLVMDNLETLLQAVTSPLTEEERKEAGNAAGGFRFSDAAYQKFFHRWLECCGKSEILVTTQEVPPLHQIKPCWLPLRGLLAEEGARLLRQFGIGGAEAELQKFSQQVDGHPLLLKLVAGFLNVEIGENAQLSDLQQLGLADLNQLLTDPRLAGIHRQETVRIVVVLDASFNRLSEKLQHLLLNLSVYRGSFSTAAAQAQLPGESVTLQDLRQLAKRSLLQEERDSQGEWQFQFQPFILAYVQHKAGNLTEAHQKAINYYLLKLKQRPWQTIDDLTEYLELFYHWCQLGNYTQAFDTIYDSNNINDDITSFLALRGYNAICVELYSQLVQSWQPQDRNEQRRLAAAFTALGNAYRSLGQYRQATEFHQQSLVTFRGIGDRCGEATSLNNLGNAYHSLRQYRKAIKFYEQSLAIQKAIGYRCGEANSLNNLGAAYNSLEEYQQAIKFLKRSLTVAQEMRDRYGEANSLGNLGFAYHLLGQYLEAIDYHQQSLTITREIGDRSGEANSLRGLGIACNFLGKHQQAIEYLQQSLTITREIGDHFGEANSWFNLGIVLKNLDQKLDALGAYRNAHNLYHAMGLNISIQNCDDEINQIEATLNNSPSTTQINSRSASMNWVQRAIEAIFRWLSTLLR